MSKRRRLFSEEELQQVLQVGREKLPEDQFQILQHIITSYSRLVALVREGTTPIERLREMFKIKRGETTATRARRRHGQTSAMARRTADSADSPWRHEVVRLPRGESYETDGTEVR
jgi:hypothetical protein